MHFKGTLICVKDLEKSKQLYCAALGLKVVGDFGANVELEGGLFLQTEESWKHFIHQDAVKLPNYAGELYFETDEFQGTLDKLTPLHLTYVHPPVLHGWGQWAVRFFDPDGHIIELAESLSLVIRRFHEGGMSVEEISAKMDVPTGYIRRILGENRWETH